MPYARVSGFRNDRVHALDAPRLALDVAGRAVMSRVRAGGDANLLAGPVPQRPTRASSSPGSSTPFSVRFVSSEYSQRS